MPAVAVLDTGSQWMKAGLATDSSPNVAFPNLVGRQGSALTMIGQDAIARAGILTLNRPQPFGLITNWDDQELVWDHTFKNELKISSDAQPICMTEYPLIPNANREKMAEIMFEKFNVPAIYVSSTAQFSLKAAGSTTGLIVDMGYHYIAITPIVNGEKQLQGHVKLEYGGHDLSEYLGKLIGGNMDINIVMLMKEELCYVASNPDSESAQSRSYTLPDGSTTSISEERYKAPEGLFKPSLLGDYDTSLLDAIVKSISKVASADQSKLYSNIVLCGGCSMFPGLADRVKKDLPAKAPSGMTINIKANDDRKYASWIGAKMTASASDFASRAITKAAYQANGASVINSCN